MPVDEGNEQESALARRPSPTPTPDAELHERDRQEVYRSVMATLREAFRKDPAALKVFESKVEGLSGPEIQKTLGWSAKEFATVDRRIRNKLDKIAEPFRNEAQS